MTRTEQQEYHHNYYITHKEQHRVACQRWSKRKYAEDPDYYMRHYRKNREKVLAKSKIKLAKLKAQVIAAYGGYCVCCGESDVRFLSLDHIHNDGAEHRKTISSGSGFYIRLRNAGFPKGQLQVMCFNCNMAKGIYGKCPHAEVLLTEVA